MCNYKYCLICCETEELQFVNYEFRLNVDEEAQVQPQRNWEFWKATTAMEP